MTLKARNRLFLGLLILGTIELVGNLAVITYAAVKNGITPPENAVRTFQLFSGKGIFAVDNNATLTGIIFFLFSAPALSFIVYRGFEKTPSTEILFFSGVILGLMTEGFRLLIPLFNLWKFYSRFLLILGQIVMTGRLLAPLSLFFSVIFSTPEERQNSERNFFLLIVIAVFCGMEFPMDTSATTTTFTVLWSFRPTFAAVRFCLFFSSVLTIFIKAIQTETKEMFLKGIGALLFGFGYILMTVTDCFIELFAAVFLSITGCVLYLRTMHYLEN